MHSQSPSLCLSKVIWVIKLLFYSPLIWIPFRQRRRVRFRAVRLTRDHALGGSTRDPAILQREVNKKKVRRLFNSFVFFM
jgi:hypothetical protein